MSEDKTSAKTETIKMPKPTIKHDWYQTDTHVVVTILVKNVENVKVDCGQRTLSVSAMLPTGSEYSLELDLANSVVAEQCSHKVMPSKIEIKLKKQDGIRWTDLEGKDPADVQINKYPSSSKTSTDWDKLEKEIVKQEATELADGETAVNALFQNIYGSGSDEVRRAMNKSFIESGGTVLNTNWGEVGQNRVKRRPPDGMEWKSWSE
ncbi:PREDICTED: suppressor of G2 allele of SKP1 homolog [Vollenhovia emeryi]|uniref:suppressor of G2 allele of SKP1 homolog n=1 Tax=Vollenhovia emeryi TaxID=411798 RepID=UPI0005F4D3C9|nr:PREDICTED: suppressor of G2 allele of SKP1 homolog [Vollenhovia emeryi]